jgi:hypothetical protein
VRRDPSGVLLACAGFAALLACSPPAEAPRAPNAPAAPPAESAAPLPFLENDFAAALSLAQERNLPLFVEVWAPW